MYISVVCIYYLKCPLSSPITISQITFVWGAICHTLSVIVLPQDHKGNDYFSLFAPFCY